MAVAGGETEVRVTVANVLTMPVDVDLGGDMDLAAELFEVTDDLGAVEVVGDTA